MLAANRQSSRDAGRLDAWQRGDPRRDPDRADQEVDPRTERPDNAGRQRPGRDGQQPPGRGEQVGAQRRAEVERPPERGHPERALLVPPQAGQPRGDEFTREEGLVHRDDELRRGRHGEQGERVVHLLPDRQQRTGQPRSRHGGRRGGLFEPRQRVVPGVLRMAQLRAQIASQEPVSRGRGLAHTTAQLVDAPLQRLDRPSMLVRHVRERTISRVFQQSPAPRHAAISFFKPMTRVRRAHDRRSRQTPLRPWGPPLPGPRPQAQEATPSPK